MNRPYEKQAKLLIEAIKQLAEDNESLENFESYLSIHFKTWLEKYANNVNNLVYEFLAFAQINTEENE